MVQSQNSNVFWCLLLASLFSWQHASASAGQSLQCRVTSVHNVSLLDCLRDQTAREILIEADAVVGDVASLQGAPLQLSRNVTIRGATEGAHTDDWPVLDLNYTAAAVHICGSCVVTFTDLAITKERRGTGPIYDFCTGEPGSRLRSINTIRVWEACTPGYALLQLVKSNRRSALFPNSTRPQDAGLHNITWKGKLYPDAYRSVYASFDIPASFDEGRGTHAGGYAQMTANSTRLCEDYVSPECLALMSGDACIQEAISRKHRTASTPPQGPVPAATIAIVVSLTIAFLLAAGLAFWQLKRRLMDRRHKDSGLHSTPEKQRGKLQRYSSTGLSHGSDDSMSGTAGSAGPRMGKPLARTTGWAHVDTQTADCIGPVEDSGIELGQLIGSGSFGKVFKGRWNGTDVAVKVIEHSGPSAEGVQQEMSMMMSFQHPNIVRAFHCITYVHNTKDESECSGSFAFPASGGIGSASSANSRGIAGINRADSTTDAAAAAAAAAGTVAGTANKHNMAGHGDRGAAAATGTACGDTVLTIHKGRASCLAQAASCQASSTGATTTLVPPEARKGSPKVHFGSAGSSGAEGSQQAPLVSAEGGGATATAAVGRGSGRGSGSGSGRGVIDTTAGSSSSPHGQQQPLPTGSLGSSVDCKCVTGDALRRTHSGARSNKSAKSTREQSRRYESWLVLEFCDRGSLAQYLSQWPPPGEALVEGDAMLRVLQLLLHTAQGLQELHGQNVVHGDLNARNVLVSSCAEEACGVQGKLADLGLSRTIRQHQTHRTTNTIGTMNHMPPKMLRSGQMSVCADTYALGIMMWELYTGEEAFQGLQHPGQFFETIVLQDLRPVIPPGMPADYQLLMQHCWATEPSARPKISRVLEALQYMVCQRQQQQAADGASSGLGPLPVLLSMPPPPAMGGGLPSGSPPSGILITPSSSDTPLPVLSMHQPIDHDTWAQHDTHRHHQHQQQQQFGAQKQQQQQSGKQQAPQDAHVQGGGAGAGGSGGFGFFRNLSARRSSSSASNSRPLDAADTSRENSDSRQGSSSGRVPTLLQGLGHSMRASGLVLRDMSFDSKGPGDSRGPSWSNRQGSQSGSLGDHSWFV